MRVAPDVKTWAAVELWRWWAAPTHVGEDAVLRASTDVAPFFCCDAVWGSSRAERHRATVAGRAVVVHVQLFQAPEAPTSLHLIAFVALGKDHVCLKVNQCAVYGRYTSCTYRNALLHE